MLSVSNDCANDHLEPIDLDKLEGLPVHTVLREYCEFNKVSIQNIDILDNFRNVLERLKAAFDETDLREAGSLVLLGSVLLKLESERILLEYMSEDDRIRYLMNKGPLYKLEAEEAIRKAMLSLISRGKDKIIVEEYSREPDSASVLGLTEEDFNCRRNTNNEDLRSVIHDDDEFNRILVLLEESEHLSEKAISDTVVEDFDMPVLMEKFKENLKGKDGMRLDDFDMDYMDAFVTSLQLSTMGEVGVYQNNFGDPIIVIPHKV